MPGPPDINSAVSHIQFVEWNDRFRDTVRRFWRGDREQTADLATLLAGSSDVQGGRGPLAGINYVTSHDGFTLHDLVSYDHKHNLANGESNADGADANFSWNCGVEGPTDDHVVRGVRLRQKLNLIATLLLSLGVPMIGGRRRTRPQPERQQQRLLPG